MRIAHATYPLSGRAKSHSLSRLQGRVREGESSETRPGAELILRLLPPPQPSPASGRGGRLIAAGAGR